MARRLLVIGGDAAGMSAASQAARRSDGRLEVVVLERSGWTSYSACGIPYWIAGEVKDGPDALVARTPEEHRANGIDVRLGVTAVGLDLDRQRVQVAGAAEEWVGFDELVVATGARPVRPDLPGIDAGGVLGVQNLDAGQRVVDVLRGSREVRRVAVVGAGYIGVEMAEALCARGLDVTVLQQAAEPMASLDPEMGAQVREALTRLGAEVHCESEVTGFATGPDGWVEAVHVADTAYPADLVVLGIGVEPASQLAVDAGLPVGESRGISTDDRMAVADGVWAAGDCVEVRHRVSGQSAYVPLGTHANKQGRVAGINITGGAASFPGVVGTAITRAGDLEVAHTGLGLAAATEAGLSAVAETVEATTMAGYMPGAEPMSVRMVAESGSGRLLGVQIAGGAGAAKRIDVAALALWHRMTADELIQTDLAYAPPYSSVWDPLQMAARKVARAVRDA